MLKNLFQDRENSGNIIVKAPNKALLESIYQYNDKIDSFEKNIKRAALIFVIIMAVIWIGGDIAGMNFRYNNESYAFFSISDIEVYNEYKIKDDGTYPLGDECYAVFSLTRPHVDNRCYKMVASIF